jgi:glycyl-tRNA synthetase beta chain
MKVPKKKNQKTTKMTEPDQTADLVFEIGCEELPASVQPRAAHDLRLLLEKHFSAHRILTTSTRLETFAAPRRLAALVTGLRVRQPDTTQEVLGPPRNVAYDDVGRPTKALSKFMARNELAPRQITVVSTPKGEYVVGRKVIRGAPTAKLLERILPTVVRELTFPRTMYWTTPSALKFSRPIRWILAAFAGSPVPFSLEGVRSSVYTQGHRFLAKKHRIAALSPQQYVEELRKNFVLVDPQQRRERIERQAARLASRRGLQVRPDPQLLNELVYLNEYPTVIIGQFDPRFLSLPEEILVTVMRGHQKYLALDNRQGKLAPFFLAVVNLAADDGRVRKGHERVLRARFADAEFFWTTDLQQPLEAYLPRLEKAIFESRLGSYLDKVQRLIPLAIWLAEVLKGHGIAADTELVQRAARLAKCDLVTEMVREFPELQGVVGGLYARQQGEPEEVAIAVYDHYRPAGLDDRIPRGIVGQIVALADRLDTLVGCFGAGLVPTGSSDPFGLRRAALATAKIILEARLPIALSKALDHAAGLYAGAAQPLKLDDETRLRIRNFVLERARYYLRERFGYAYDEINAVFAAGADDLVDAEARIAAVRAVRKTEFLEPLSGTFKRIRNILEKAQREQQWIPDRVDPSLFQDAEESALHETSEKLKEVFDRLYADQKYREALEQLASFRPAVDRFFDHVLVMAEDNAVRANRLALLADVLRAFSRIADFSELGANGTSGVE